MNRAELEQVAAGLAEHIRGLLPPADARGVRPGGTVVVPVDALWTAFADASLLSVELGRLAVVR